MKLNDYDYSVLENIAQGIELTLEICDLYLDSNSSKEIKRIIRKLKAKIAEVYKICYYYGCNNEATEVLDAKLMDSKTGLMTVPFPIDCCEKCYKLVMKVKESEKNGKKRN